MNIMSVHCQKNHPVCKPRRIYLSVSNFYFIFLFYRTRSIFQFGLPTDTCVEPLFKITKTKNIVIYCTRSDCDTRLHLYSSVYYVCGKLKLDIEPYTLISKSFNSTRGVYSLPNQNVSTISWRKSSARYYYRRQSSGRFTECHIIVK